MVVTVVVGIGAVAVCAVVTFVDGVVDMVDTVVVGEVVGMVVVGISAVVVVAGVVGSGL